MNAGIFGSYLVPIWRNNTPTSISDAADKMATAYHISNIGQSTTPFAAPLINADKSILKTFFELGMSINFYGGQTQSTISSLLAIGKGAVGGDRERVKAAEKLSTKVLKSLVSKLPLPLTFIGTILTGLVTSIFAKLKTDSSESNELTTLFNQLEGIIKLADTTKIGYLVMSTGVCLYWLSSRISPVPPMPPCIAPTFGTQVIIPGLPVPLNSDLHDTFKYPQQPEEAIAKFYNSLILHQFTVIGIYGGIIPFFPSPIPGPPIPWFSILNIPFPNIKLPKILDKDGDGVKDKKTTTTRGSGAGGTSSGGRGSNTGIGTQTGTGTGPTGSGGTQTGGTPGGGSTQSGTGTGAGTGTGTGTGAPLGGTTGTGNASTTFGGSASNPSYNPPSSISTFLSEETTNILTSMNPYGLSINTDVTYKPIAQLVVEIRENTNLLNNGDREYQYSITVQLDNLAQDVGLNGSQLNLPTSISEKRVYTFKDTVEGTNSIFSQVIVSPKLRAIELMKSPYRSALSFVISDGIRKYIDKWYGGKLPDELKVVSFYATTTMPDAGDAIGSNVFVPLQKFHSLA